MWCEARVSSVILAFHQLNSRKVEEAEVGVKCGSKLISMLLYADDAVIFAGDEMSMRLGLDVLMGWCRE